MLLVYKGEVGVGEGVWPKLYILEIQNLNVQLIHMVKKTFSWELYLSPLEDTARYTGLLIAPAEGFGQGFCCPSGKKKSYYAVLAHFWQFLVSSINLGNF